MMMTRRSWERCSCDTISYELWATNIFLAACCRRRDVFWLRKVIFKDKRVNFNDTHFCNIIHAKIVYPFSSRWTCVTFYRNLWLYSGWSCVWRRDMRLTVCVQHFQRRPLEVLVDGEQWQVIRRPETLQDILSTFI